MTIDHRCKNVLKAFLTFLFLGSKCVTSRDLTQSMNLAAIEVTVQLPLISPFFLQHVNLRSAYASTAQLHTCSQGPSYTVTVSAEDHTRTLRSLLLINRPPRLTNLADDFLSGPYLEFWGPYTTSLYEEPGCLYGLQVRQSIVEMLVHDKNSSVCSAEEMILQHI